MHSDVNPVMLKFIGSHQKKSQALPEVTFKQSNSVLYIKDRHKPLSPPSCSFTFLS